jgi:hypothetical protein
MKERASSFNGYNTIKLDLNILSSFANRIRNTLLRLVIFVWDILLQVKTFIFKAITFSLKRFNSLILIIR